MSASNKEHESKKTNEYVLFSLPHSFPLERNTVRWAENTICTFVFIFSMHKTIFFFRSSRLWWCLKLTFNDCRKLATWSFSHNCKMIKCLPVNTPKNVWFIFHFGRFPTCLWNRKSSHLLWLLREKVLLILIFSASFRLIDANKLNDLTFDSTSIRYFIFMKTVWHLLLDEYSSSLLLVLLTKLFF